MKSLEQECIDKIESGDLPFFSVPEEYRTHDVCLAAVKKNWRSLEYVTNQTEEMCWEAINQNGEALEYVKNQTEEMCLAAVESYWPALDFVKNQTEEMCLTAVKEDCMALEMVRRQTDRICLAAVSHEPEALLLVRNQTDEICLAAVRKDWALLKHVKNQTEEICDVAINQNGWALEYVRKQTEVTYKKAFNNNISSFIYVDADVYKYDKNDIEKVFNLVNFNIGKNGEDKTNYFLTKVLNKTAEILAKLSEDELLEAVTVDLSSIFTDKNINICEDLFNIKSKIDMLYSVGGSDAINNHNKKPKMI